MREPIQEVLVVVPAHDEERLLGRCLAHVASAADAVGREGRRVRTVVVLDACVDATEAVASAHGVAVVGCTARNVGIARARGVAALADGSRRPATTWVATTDADSRVPASWLVEMVAAADAGHDLVTGPVRPEPADLEPPLLQRWLSAHTAGQHVHGANLGFRLSTYVTAGGFPPLATGEDRALVAALRALGARTATGVGPVVTSGRTTGRAPDGFASYLSALTRGLVPGESA